MYEYDTLIIGGEHRAPAGSGVITVRSPATEDVLGRVPEPVNADVDSAVAAARTAFDTGPWPRWSPAARAAVLRAAADELQVRHEELAQLITAQVGSPITFSRFGQVAPAIGQLRYYADLVETFEFETELAGPGRTLVTREPAGVVAAVVPWNAPLFIAVNKIAPALAVGCAVVLKPAPESPLDAYLLADALRVAGLPPGVLSVLHAHRDVAEYLVGHPGIDKVTFTGSTEAGSRVMAACGPGITRVTLELGGKSAALVLDDANLDEHLGGLMMRMFANNGQVCTAQTRILVSRSRYDDVVGTLATAIEAMRIGDPSEETTELGPLIARRQRDRVEGFIAAGREAGARVVTGGGRPDHLARGWYVTPTLFADVDNAMTIAQEEIFGPVVCVIAYEDVDHAVALANDSRYGLYGSVWTSDVEYGTQLARRVRVGNYSVNGAWGAADAPFGGLKASGFGRELGPAGLQAFVEEKSIHVA